MFRRRITFPGMALATALGVASGVYIYKPMFKPPNKNMTHQDDVIVVQSGDDVDDHKTTQVTSN